MHDRIAAVSTHGSFFSPLRVYPRGTVSGSVMLEAGWESVKNWAPLDLRQTTQAGGLRRTVGSPVRHPVHARPARANTRPVLFNKRGSGEPPELRSP